MLSRQKQRLAFMRGACSSCALRSPSISTQYRQHNHTCMTAVYVTVVHVLASWPGSCAGWSLLTLGSGPC